MILVYVRNLISGLILSQEPFNCQVHAFDPSPIATAFIKESVKINTNPNYHFHPYGGGGSNEVLQLREYDWGTSECI